MKEKQEKLWNVLKGWIIQLNKNKYKCYDEQIFETFSRQRFHSDY